MSYANGTQFYNLPQTVGTDKRDWFDTNSAFAAIDAALHSAVTGQASDAEAIATINGKLADDEADIAALQTKTTTHDSQIAALQTSVNTQASQIQDVRQDAEDMITANNEGAAATSTRAYEVGDYFIYNDVLYKATAAIAIGDTIVPNTNCEATNVDTELTQLNSDLESLFTDSVTLYSGSFSGGDDITLSDNINNYKLFTIIDSNTDDEATQTINTRYKSAVYPSIIASIVEYNNTGGVLVLADVALTSSDGIHYHCERSVQWNLDGNGIAYFSTNQSAPFRIVGYR